MRKAVILGGFVLALAASAAFAITEKQSTIIPLLDALKLKVVPANVIGGPQTYEVTKETVELLTKLQKDGGTIVIEGDGTIKINAKKK